MNSDPRVLPIESVQHFLNQLDPMQPFYCIFLKANGQQREMQCQLIPSESRGKNPLPVDTPEGIRSFRLDRVLHIGVEL